MPVIESFRGLTAVITGAAGGMGRELAVQLAAEGCHLALCDVRMDDLEETRRLCHSQAAQTEVTCTTHFCDVSSVESIGAFRAAVGEAHR